MKNILLILLLAITSYTLCNAQKIETKNTFWGTKYIQNGNRLTLKGLVNAMEPNSEAATYMMKGKKGSVISSVFAGAGGACLGFAASRAIRGEDASWPLVGAGAGLVAVGVPISLRSLKNINQAIDLHNSSLAAATTKEYDRELAIVAHGSRIGLSISF